METPYFSGRSWLVVVLFSLLSASLGSWGAVTLDSLRFSETGGLAQAHLIYALQLKDDMAVIDWSKALQRLPSAKVFRVKNGDKTSFLGGNESLLIPDTPLGIYYRFPFDWIDRSILKTAGASYELIILYQDNLFPLLGTIGFGALPWIFVGLLHVCRPKPIPSVHQAAIPSPAREPAPTAHPVSRTIESNEAFLVLDSDYIIREATTAAAQELGKDLTTLIDSHFLDLSPAPSVMQAIKEGQETRLLKPFPACPDLTVQLQKTGQGWTLRFEGSPSPKGPKQADFIDFDGVKI